MKARAAALFTPCLTDTRALEAHAQSAPHARSRYRSRYACTEGMCALKAHTQTRGTPSLRNTRWHAPRCSP